MKKYLILFLISIFLVTGCNDKKVVEKEENKNNTVENSTEEIKEPEVPEYTDNNPIKVGLYIGENNTTKLIKEYHNTWARYTDIIVFSTFFTNEEYLVSMNTANTFDYYKNKYSDIDNYRIGYNVKFTSVNGDSINKTMLDTIDPYLSPEYLLFYFYDDLGHRNDSWYSHITESEWNSNILMTSFKITGGNSFGMINSPITVTVFTYDSMDDFDENGEYRGNSKYTAVLYNTNG